MTQQLIDRVAALQEENRRRVVATEQLNERVVALGEQNQQLTSRVAIFASQNEELVGQVAGLRRQVQEQAELQRDVRETMAWWSRSTWWGSWRDYAQGGNGYIE